MKRLLFALALPVCAQEVEHRLGNYRAATSYELGYRSVWIDGNEDAYRSAVNYNNGFRLFNGLVRLNSRDGRGRFADEVVLTTLGSGGDPYQSNTLRLEKHRWYRFDMGFRVVNYRNRLLSIAGGEHGFNTERIFQSYDLTLFPQRKVQLLFGFDRNNQNGPAFSSLNIDVRGEPAFLRDRFFVFADNVRRVNNTWRGGANAALGAVKLSFLQGWDFYKDDTTHAAVSAVQHRRSDPVHGMTPFSRLGVHTDANRRLTVNGRLVYAGGERNFVLDENITSLGATLVTRQAYVLGRAKRNQGAGDVTLAFTPVEPLTVSNTTSVNQTRITGDAVWVEMREPVNRLDPGRNDYYFDFLGIRHVSNQTDLSFRPSRLLGFYGGYHYSIRRIQSREMFEDISGALPEPPALDTFENTTHAVLAGVRLRPVSPLTVLLDFEHGRADRPFTPISDKRYHGETVRLEFRRQGWLLTGGFKAYRNRNSPPAAVPALEGALSSPHRLQSRQYTFALAYTPPKTRWTFDGGYSKLHLDTASGIVNLFGPLVSLTRTVYRTELHHAHASLRVELPRQATLFLGYSLVQDTADPDCGASFLCGALFFPASPTLTDTAVVNAYPLNYQSPQARLTIRLHRKLSWNGGWQYYGYSEKFTGLQNYFAHLAYTSLRWSF
jgi:hypothetical protein